MCVWTAVLLLFLGTGVAMASPSPFPSAEAAVSAPATQTSGEPLPHDATPNPAASSEARRGTVSDPVGGIPYAEGPREWRHGEEINWGRQIATTMIWLVLMCGAIWLILRVLYGRVGFGGFGQGSKRTIQVIDRHFLGPQRALITVRVPGKVLLLGMTEQTITTLAELSPEDLEVPTLAGGIDPGVRLVSEVPVSSEPPRDNIVDLAALFGRRGAQSGKGDDAE